MGVSALALASSWTGCAGARPPSPGFSPDLYHTVVFKYARKETRRYSDAAEVRDFVERLNKAKRDSTLETVQGACWVYLLGREGTQQLKVAGTDFRVSGAGCRFRQAHCNYRADFDVEALCRPK